ncbi:MAG TPA: protein kinase [Thermoanaerobaculia bacterium]|nr:protein kinase [Thermoanaerobaculia bacterium]
MTLTTGDRLGPYEIQSPIGAGGMGEVYKARDTRLDRIVAVKVLPQNVSASSEGRQRFEREAKTISQLSHPHICALYDVGNQDGVEYLVLEYLEGETLAERLLKGPLPLDQVLRSGIEIADALDKAHHQGIVHRDLKPGNVMLTRSGVKLLDFGLAKGMVPPRPPSALTSLPTMAAGRSLTQEGTILGTFQYMAPEQLEGKEADSRTDLFAFGALLHEMATGNKAFSGASQASLVSSIMTAQPPPISLLQPMSPPALDRVVQTCLAKDPEDRWQTAHDVMLQLRWVAEGGSLAGVPAPVSARRRTRERLGWIVAAVLLAAGLPLALAHFRESPPEARVTQFVIQPPAKMTIGLGPAAPQAALSPDGHHLAFSLSESSNRNRNLWIRPLDSLAPHMLAGTEDATIPFWSPDGRTVGFFTQEKLKTVLLSGGSPQTLVDVTAVGGGTWNREGVILFATTAKRGIGRIPASGGAATDLTVPDRKRDEVLHVFPQFLPDGRHYLFFVLCAKQGATGVYLGSLDSQERKQLVRSEGRGLYAPSGYLLFLRQGTLMAQRFDVKGLRLVGEPARIADGVAYNPLNGRNTMTVSENGILAYRAGVGSGVPVTELAWFDRDGKRLGIAAQRGFYLRPELSPDGQRIVVERMDTREDTRDLWMVDESRSTLSRLTFGPKPANQTQAVWSPDSTRVVFASDRDGAYGLYEKLANGTGAEQALLKSDMPKVPTDWSGDGRFLLYDESNTKSGWDVWVLPLFGDRKAAPLLHTDFYEGQGHFSPDGRWIAYVSDESGRREVYVQAFPLSGAKWQISTDGGNFPRWRRDGKELFYFSPDQKLMAVEISADSTFRPGKPAPLFEAHYFNIPIAPYSLSADGRKFLINTPVDEETNTNPVTVVLNWPALLPR